MKDRFTSESAGVVEGRVGLGAAGEYLLSAGDVHVWQIPLAAREGALGSFLSEDEVLRAERFRFEKDRVRFTAARLALREILSRYLGVNPGKVAFSYGAHGKPELGLDFRGSGIEFNLSHSGDFALLALARGCRVGADIELVNLERATGDIARRFFSDAEVVRLEALAEDERGLAFFQCWTRKEAYVKAVGAGLSLPLSSFDVAFGPGVLAALLSVGGSVESWSLFDVPCAEGYVGAVAVEGRGLRLWERPWDEV